MKHWGKRFLADGLVKTLGLIRDVSRFPAFALRGTGCKPDPRRMASLSGLPHRSLPCKKERRNFGAC